MKREVFGVTDEKNAQNQFILDFRQNFVFHNTWPYRRNARLSSPVWKVYINLTPNTCLEK
jgi:hypothetical protein